MSAGEKLGLTNSSPKPLGGPSVAIRWPGGGAWRYRSVHTAGITRLVLLIRSVRRRTRPGGHGGAPGERQDEEERGHPPPQEH
jgi:hypothetical protein